MAGDINKDGTVNTADLVLLQKYLLGDAFLTQTQAETADLLEDQIVNGLDLVKLRQYVIF